MTAEQIDAMNDLVDAMKMLHPRDSVWRTPTDNEAVYINRSYIAAVKVLDQVYPLHTDKTIIS